jgi:hypothetical protein
MPPPMMTTRAWVGRLVLMRLLGRAMKPAVGRYDRQM